MLKQRVFNKTDDNVSETSNQNRSSKNKEKVFNDVARAYRKLNNITFFGLLHVWRNIFISRLDATEHTKLLDMAGGTGEIAFLFLNYIKKNNVEKNCHVTVCDINESMLEVGRSLCKTYNYNPSLISWVKDDAENLSFKDQSFNMYTISFGLRTCAHTDKVLNEAYRVLQPGGKFLCLEYSHVKNPILKWLCSLYCSYILPLLGYITGYREAYHYLKESIRQATDQETLKKMIEEAGFQQVTYENCFGGMTAIHIGIKP